MTDDTIQCQCGKPAKYRTTNIDHLDGDKKTVSYHCGIHGTGAKEHVRQGAVTPETAGRWTIHVDGSYWSEAL